jgi:hypothetical protein
MSRDRHWLRYEDLRSFRLAELPTFTRRRSARWTVRMEWPESRSQDGAILEIKKAHDGAVSVDYCCGSNAIVERVPLAFQSCHFGGVRSYFCCPACGGRCTTLYIGGSSIRCRQCVAGAIYASQGTNAAGRALRRFIKLRATIEPDTERANLMYFPDRPKRMRHATYARIKPDALDARDRYWGGLNARLVPRLTRMLDRMSTRTDCERTHRGSNEG